MVKLKNTLQNVCHECNINTQFLMRCYHLKIQAMDVSQKKSKIARPTAKALADLSDFFLYLMMLTFNIFLLG